MVRALSVAYRADAGTMGWHVWAGADFAEILACLAAMLVCGGRAWAVREQLRKRARFQIAKDTLCDVGNPYIAAQSALVSSVAYLTSL